MAHPVYIIHAASDAEMAGKVSAYLESKGIACFTDSESGSDKDGWSIMLLILSQGANDAEEILQEVGIAIAANKVLIPFRIENFRPNGEMQDFLRWRYVHEAFSPPLEEHLEELVRMIRPLLHGRSTKLTEATSISRTLPSRSAILQKPAKPEAGAPSDRSLRLYLNFPHLVIAGISTTIDCRLENSDSHPLADLRATLECGGIKHEATHLLGELSPGNGEDFAFEIQPGGFGQFNLRVTVEWRKGDTISSWSGNRSLRIYEAFSSGEFPAALQTFSQQLENTTLSQLGHLAIPSSITSSEELARFTLPERFEPLDLTPDYEVRIASRERAESYQPLTIPDAFLDQVHTGTVLQLTPLDITENDPHQAIRLVARPQFVLGRSGEESDFVLWFWPRNEVHDTKTRRISKKHVTFSADGKRLLARNTAAGSLTTYDGQDVTAAGTPLHRRGLLNLSGIYLLEVAHIPSLSKPLQITNLMDRQDDSASHGSPTAHGSVRLSQRSAGVLPQNSTWLLSDATFGSSSINPVILDTPGLADIQGRFHHAQGAFWLESFTDNSEVQLNDQFMMPGWVAPLKTGQTLKLSSVNYSVFIS